MKTKNGFFISWVICILFCTIAFILLSLDYINYGLSMFCVFPIILGVATGIIPDRKGALLGLMVGLASFFILLLATGNEGIICLIMATPIITLLVFFGYLFYSIYKRIMKSKKRKTYMTIYPLLAFVLSGHIEQRLYENPVKEEVTTTVFLPYGSEDVYDHIIQVDTVHAPPGLLHQLGLPRPLNCILTEEAIGGLRICEFNEGKIVETITAFERGKYLNMKVSCFDMKGRPWLNFDEDRYTMNPTEGGTMISRSTSYYSDLKPRFYWSYIEALTIKEEQELVFRNLLLDLQQ